MSLQHSSLNDGVGKIYNNELTYDLVKQLKCLKNLILNSVFFYKSWMKMLPLNSKRVLINLLWIYLNIWVTKLWSTNHYEKRMCKAHYWMKYWHLLKSIPALLCETVRKTSTIQHCLLRHGFTGLFIWGNWFVTCHIYAKRFR